MHESDFIVMPSEPMDTAALLNEAVSGGGRVRACTSRACACPARACLEHATTTRRAFVCACRARLGVLQLIGPCHWCSRDKDKGRGFYSVGTVLENVIERFQDSTAPSEVAVCALARRLLQGVLPSSTRPRRGMALVHATGTARVTGTRASAAPQEARSGLRPRNPALCLQPDSRPLHVVLRVHVRAEYHNRSLRPSASPSSGAGPSTSPPPQLTTAASGGGGGSGGASGSGGSPSSTEGAEGAGGAAVAAAAPAVEKQPAACSRCYRACSHYKAKKVAEILGGTTPAQSVVAVLNRCALCHGSTAKVHLGATKILKKLEDTYEKTVRPAGVQAEATVLLTHLRARIAGERAPGDVLAASLVRGGRGAASLNPR